MKLEHVYRELNRIVDCLALMSMMHDRGVQLYKEPPTQIKLILWEDIMGIVWSRRVPMN